MSNKNTNNLPKFIMTMTIIIFIGTLSGSLFYLLNENQDTDKTQQPEQNQIKSIELSEDKKSVLNSETKEVVFTIIEANSYGYPKYNSKIPATVKAIYGGECFSDVALSNKKDRIVFSTGCLAKGDVLLQTWIGIYNINWGSDPNTNCANTNCLGIPKFKFLISGSGKNFTWSEDDKIITYEADLEAGMTETRTIDAGMGEILKSNKSEIKELELEGISKLIYEAYKII